MRIIPFPSRLSKKAEMKAEDWCQQELADFYRAHRLLVENGTGIGIDRGLSDIGEPWMVFFDVASQDVFLHVARIDGRCQLICDALNIRLSAANISVLISEFEQTVREHLAIRSERRSNVVLHPASRIIMSISAVFLLFKLGKGDAHARDLGEKTAVEKAADKLAAEKDHAGSEAGQVFVSDPSSSALSRAQAAFARVFDSVDAPANVAVLVGIILAGELSAHHDGIIFTAASAADEAPVPVHVSETSDLLPVDLDSHTLLARALVAEAHPHGPVAEPVEVAAVAVNPIMTQAAIVVSPVVVKSAFADTVQDVRHEIAPELKLADDAMLAPVAEETKPEATNEALKALKVLGLKLDDTPVHVVDAKPSAPETTAAQTDPTHTIKSITATNLGEIDDKVGFFAETHLDEKSLYALLQHFTAEMGQFDFDYSNGKVLIEEKHVTSLADHDIGLWTNVMGDGSSISVIGHAGLIDDVMTFFS